MRIKYWLDLDKNEIEISFILFSLDKLFAETFKSFRRNIFKEAKVDTDLYNILYEIQSGIGKRFDRKLIFQYFQL